MVTALRLCVILHKLLNVIFSNLEKVYILKILKSVFRSNFYVFKSNINIFHIFGMRILRIPADVKTRLLLLHYFNYTGLLKLSDQEILKTTWKQMKVVVINSFHPWVCLKNWLVPAKTILMCFHSFTPETLKFVGISSKSDHSASAHL